MHSKVFIHDKTKREAPLRKGMMSAAALTSAAYLVLLAVSMPDCAEPVRGAEEALRKRDVAGAFMYYAVFTQDPRYSYLRDGVVDNAKYAALAAPDSSW
jgi:hypothetical protein